MCLNAETRTQEGNYENHEHFSNIFIMEENVKHSYIFFNWKRKHNNKKKREREISMIFFSMLFSEHYVKLCMYKIKIQLWNGKIYIWEMKISHWKDIYQGYTSKKQNMLHSKCMHLFKKLMF